MGVEFVAGREHYEKVVQRVASVRRSLWIGTADIKDVYVMAGDLTKPGQGRLAGSGQGRGAEPLLAVIARLLKRGVEVRLIHAKEPGPAFREDFDRYPVLYEGLERMLCPRVHFKMLVFDCDMVYVGSANLTGAGIGMKSASRRNFEAGILTDDRALVEAAMEEFDAVWRGAHCARCGRRAYCVDPVVG